MFRTRLFPLALVSALLLSTAVFAQGGGGGGGGAGGARRPEPPAQKKKRIADPTKRCNRIVAVCCPEVGEFIQ